MITHRSIQLFGLPRASVIARLLRLQGTLACPGQAR
jgi:hypothetical protein